jgi:signal transduction histidine kinase
VVWFGLGFLAQVASAVNSAVTLLRERAEDDLKAAATAIAWAEARLRQRTWAGQVRLSRVLHGEVQARIVSAALQLQLHPPEDPLSHIEQLNLAIQSALRQRTDTSFSTSLEHLHALWGSAIDFTIDVDPEALRLLDTDPDGAQAVSEVVREATTNAVRHGDADCVHVRVLALDNWIEVVVTDDGCGVAQLRGSGLGSELFDALTMEWSIEGQPGARFTARIASADTQREVLK